MSKTVRRKDKDDTWYWMVGRDLEKISRGEYPDSWSYEQRYAKYNTKKEGLEHYRKWCQAVYHSDKSRRYSNYVPSSFRRHLNEKLRTSHRQCLIAVLKDAELQTFKEFEPFKRNALYLYR